MLASLTPVLLAFQVSAAQPVAVDNPYFQPDSAQDVIAVFENAGYEVVETDTLWIVDPRMFAIRMHVYDTPGEPVSAVRFFVEFDIGDSQPAQQAVRYYEETSLIAEVSVVEADDSRQVILKRDVLLAGGRTETNVIANAQLLFQLTPVFANSLAQADPSLTQAIIESVQP